MIEPVAAELRKRIGSGYYGDDDTTLPGAIVRALTERGLTLGTAESCTGGAVADEIVGVAGASAIFRGGIVAYANEVKTALLDVPERTLAQAGAVSEETAAAMARGARARLGVGRRDRDDRRRRAGRRHAGQAGGLGLVCAQRGGRDRDAPAHVSRDAIRHTRTRDRRGAGSFVAPPRT